MTATTVTWTMTDPLGNTLTVSVTPPPLTISGTAQVGQTLTAAGGTGVYQWYNEGSAISGAASSTYALQGTDQGCLIQVLSGGAFSAMAGPVLGATVFYVSSSTGNDSNAGTLAAPWKTLAHVNAQTFSPSTSILFKRGDTWRTDGNSPNSLGAQLRLSSSGSAGNPIVSDAYGPGANPIIDGSFDASATGAWTLTGTSNVWQSVQTFPPSTGNASGLPNNQANDVGNILWGFSAAGGTNVPAAVANANVGVMTGGGTGGVWYKPGDGQAHLVAQGQWNFNTDNYRVQIYSTSNPATAMPGLSLAIDTACIYIVGQSYLTFQNISLNNFGMSPIMSQMFGTTGANNIIIRESVVQWYGGGNIGGASNGNSRFGDGVDIEGSAQNWLIERNWFYQAYDVAVGPQCGGAHQDNITVRNNVFCQCGGGVSEFIFNNPTVNGLYVYNNTMLGAPGGWSCSPIVQRPNGAPNIYGLYPGALTQVNMIVENNIFAGVGGASSNPGFGVIGTQWSSAGNPSNPFAGTVWLDYNCWPKNTETGNSQQIALTGANFTLSSWAAGTITGRTFAPALETHGIFDHDPMFTSQATLNFVPQSGSLCRNAGVNLFSAGVVWDINHNPRPSSGAFTIGAFQ